MMHARIVETPKRDRLAPFQALLRGRTPSIPDRNYYHQRAAEESDAARRAVCIEARLAHAELAEAYRLLCGSCERADLLLAAEPSIFLPNGKPANRSCGTRIEIDLVPD